MRTLALCFAVAVAALAIAPSAFADGPIYVTQGGAGVTSQNGAFHYVALPNGRGATLLVKVYTAGTEVYGSMTLPGLWGTALIGNGGEAGQGLSRDGRTLVLESTTGPLGSSSKFLVVDPTHWKVLRADHAAGLVHLRRALAGRVDDVPDPVHGVERPDPLQRARVRPAHEPAAARQGRRSGRGREREGDGRLCHDPDDERQRPLGVHALPEAVRHAVHPRARHGPRRGALHRSAGESAASTTSSSGSATATARSRCTGGAGVPG